MLSDAYSHKSVPRAHTPRWYVENNIHGLRTSYPNKLLPSYKCRKRIGPCKKSRVRDRTQGKLRFFFLTSNPNIIKGTKDTIQVHGKYTRDTPN